MKKEKVVYSKNPFYLIFKNETMLSHQKSNTNHMMKTKYIIILIFILAFNGCKSEWENCCCGNLDFYTKIGNGKPIPTFFEMKLPETRLGKRTLKDYFNLSKGVKILDSYDLDDSTKVCVSKCIGDTFCIIIGDSAKRVTKHITSSSITKIKFMGENDGRFFFYIKEEDGHCSKVYFTRDGILGISDF